MEVFGFYPLLLVVADDVEGVFVGGVERLAVDGEVEGGVVALGMSRRDVVEVDFFGGFAVGQDDVADFDLGDGLVTFWSGDEGVGAEAGTLSA